MIRKIIAIALPLIFTIVAICVNAQDFVFGTKKIDDRLELCASVLFILSWIINSFLMANYYKKGYLRFISFYFGLSFILTILTDVLGIYESSFTYLTMIAPAFTAIIPLYGLTNGINDPNMKWIVMTIFIGIVYALSTLSFLAGKLNKKIRY